MGVSTSPVTSQMAMAIRRRDPVERRILMLVRGADRASQRRPGATPNELRLLQTEEFARIAELGRLAIERGLEIQQPEAPYVSQDELLLLGWLAEAQRTAPSVLTPSPSLALQAAILAAAETLNMLGWWLPPLTLYSARSRVRGAAREMDGQ